MPVGCVNDVNEQRARAGACETGAQSLSLPLVRGWKLRLKTKLTCRASDVGCEMVPAELCSLLCTRHVFPMCLGHLLEPLLGHISAHQKQPHLWCSYPCLVCVGPEQELAARGLDVSWGDVFRALLDEVSFPAWAHVPSFAVTLRHPHKPSFDSCLACATERVRNSPGVQMQKDLCSVCFPVPCTESEGFAKPFYQSKM